MASRELAFDEARLVESHCHAHPGLWFIEHPGFVSGANYRWFRDHFAAEEIARFAATDFTREAKGNRQGVRLGFDGAPFAGAAGRSLEVRGVVILE